MAAPVTNNLPFGPATDALAANHSDTVNLTNGPCRGLYIGVSGNVKVTMQGGSEVTFLSVPIGLLAVAALRVWSTGTTATNIIVMY